MAKESNRIPWEFSLKGRLITSKDPSTIGENFQGLRNLRYTGVYPEGIGGMTAVNSSAPTTGSTGAPKIKAGFHYRKDNPSETHMIVHAFDSSTLNARIYQKTDSIPSTGDFSTGKALYTLADTTGNKQGVFSAAPNGAMTFTDGEDSLIYGGDEYQVGRFVNFTTTGIGNGTLSGNLDEDGLIQKKIDYTEAIRNTLTDSDNVAKLVQGSSDTYFYLGATRPIDGFKAYIGAGTNNASTGNFTLDHWAGSSWATLANLSTSGIHGGSSIPFSQTGSVSFSSTHSISSVKLREIDGVALYWYRGRVTTKMADANSEIAHISVSSPMQPVKDVWDGDLRVAASVKVFDSSKFLEYAPNVFEDTYDVNSSGTWVNFKTLATGTDYVVCGFTEPMMGLEMHFIDGSNDDGTTAATTVKYSVDAKNWTSVGTVLDYTSGSSGVLPLTKSGIISWSPLDFNTEFQQSIEDNINLYYYQLTWDKNIGSSAKCYYVAGIPAPQQIRGYKYATLAKNRTWLANNEDGFRNEVLVSSQGAPDVYNGEDSIKLYFGDNSDITGLTSLYSVLGSNIFDVVLVFKKDSLYGVSGGTPLDFTQYEISVNDGLIAPKTLKTAVMTIGENHAPVVIWQGSKGMYMFNNRTPIPIHDDISNFFDPREVSSSNKINSSYVHLSNSFYDKENSEYHWMFADGNSGGLLNREFVFDLSKGFWFEIVRGSSGSSLPLQAGWSVTDTNGNEYNYGARDNGIVERLENGTSFDGTAIEHEFHTGDIAMDEGKIMMSTSLRKVKLVATSSTVSSLTDDITVSHYVNSATTANSTFSLSPIETGSRLIMGTNAKKSLKANKSGSFHSLKVNISTTSVNYGFTPIFLGGHFQRDREDF